MKKKQRLIFTMGGFLIKNGRSGVIDSRGVLVKIEMKREMSFYYA
jgi:hypothetical protein